MTARTLVQYDGTDIKALSSAELVAIQKRLIYLYAEAPTVVLTRVSGSGANCDAISDTRKQAGATSQSSTAFVAEGTTAEPGTVTVSFDNINVKEKITAIFIIIGSINLPIIKYSVDWWNTLHQPASISKFGSSSIDASMMKPLLLMTLSFALIGLLIALLRIKSEILSRKLKL